MPLYEYRCAGCGNSFEKIQKFSEAPERECPKCGGVLVRPVTAPALKFEGAGWYVNDYAGKGRAKTAEGAAPAAAADTKSTKSAAEEGGGSKDKAAPVTPAPTPASSGTPSSN